MNQESPTISVTSVPWSLFPGVPSFFQAYVEKKASTAGFFPHSPEEVAKAAAEVRSHSYQREEIVECLARGLEDLEAPEEARESLRRISNPETVVVIAGQQPGLLGSPLFLLFKAISAISTAHRLQRDGIPAVPLFWCHSADHDIDEINRVGLTDSNGVFHRHRAKLNLPPRTPIETVPVDGPVEELWRTVQEFLPHSDHRTKILEAFTPNSSDQVGTWCCRILSRLLGPYGLVPFEPRQIRHLFGPKIGQALASAETLSARMRETTRSLEQSGFSAPLDPKDTPFFYRLEDLGNGQISRQRVTIDPKDPSRVEFRGAGKGSSQERSILLEEIKNHPKRFSPAAALRPVIQSAVLPVAVSIVGPSELTYQAQLPGIFSELQVPIPVILPRVSATLVDSRSSETLAALSVDDRSIPQLNTILAPSLTEEDVKEALSPELLARKNQVLSDLDDFLRKLAELEPDLARPSQKTASRLQSEVGRLVGKFVEAQGRRTQTLHRRRKRLLSQLAPGGGPQERQLSALPFLLSYGPGLISALLTLDPFHLAHQIVRIPKIGLPDMTRTEPSVSAGEETR